MDSNTSSSITTDNIDLTVSPPKGQTSLKNRHNTNACSSHDNTEQAPIENKRETRASRKNKGISKTSDRAKLSKAQATQLKDSTIKGQESKGNKAQTKDNQTKPNTTKAIVFKTYKINQEKKKC